MAKIKKVTIAVTYPTLLTNITHSDKNIDEAKKFCSTVVTSLIAEEEGKKIWRASNWQGRQSNM